MLTAAEFARLRDLPVRTVRRWGPLAKGGRKTTRPGILGEVWEAPLESWDAVANNRPPRGVHSKKEVFAVSERNLTPAEAWEGFVGSQSVADFLTVSAQKGHRSIGSAVESYTAALPRVLDWDARTTATTDLAEIGTSLERYIRKNLPAVRVSTDAAGQFGFNPTGWPWSDASELDWPGVYPLLDAESVVIEVIDGAWPPSADDMRERGIYYDEKEMVYRYGVQAEMVQKPTLVTAENLETILDTIGTTDQAEEVAIGRTVSVYRHVYSGGCSGTITVYHDDDRGAIEFGADSEWGDYDEKARTITLDETGVKVYLPA